MGGRIADDWKPIILTSHAESSPGHTVIGICASVTTVLSAAVHSQLHSIAGKHPGQG